MDQTVEGEMRHTLRTAPTGEQVRAFPKMSCAAAATGVDRARESWFQRSKAFHAPGGTAESGWEWDCVVGNKIIREGCDNGKPEYLDGRVVGYGCGIGTGNWKGKRWGLEDLMDEFKVDMYFTGHIHMYERSWPTMRGHVQKTYTKPTFPVHINTGNSGSKNDFTLGPEADFSAYRLAMVGCYSSVKIHNATHLTFEQKDANNGTVIDGFDLEKER